MIIKIDYDKCNNCGICIETCPIGAIIDKNNQKKIDETRCIKCKTCVALCPLKAIKIK